MRAPLLYIGNLNAKFAVGTDYPKLFELQAVCHNGNEYRNRERISICWVDMLFGTQNWN